LVKSKLSAGESKSATWYALALADTTESIHTSHERDRSQFQEAMAFMKAPTFLQGFAEENTGYASSILVSSQLQQRIQANGSAVPVQDFDEEQHMPSRNALVKPVKKTATTAKNFFGNDTSKSNATSKTGSTATMSTFAATTTTATNNNSSSSSSSKKKSSVPTAFQPKKKERILGKAGAEKENVVNKKSVKSSGNDTKKNNKPVGNADDFEGDVESDGDDDSVVVEQNELVVEDSNKSNKSKSVPARRAYQMNDSSDNEEEQQPVEEEEAVKKTAPKKDAPKQKRRRKRMVEKTFTDENGYLYTETQAVWEDVPSDEEEAVIKTSAVSQKKAKKGPPKKMGQASIMGFFKKK